MTGTTAIYRRCFDGQIWSPETEQPQKSHLPQVSGLHHHPLVLMWQQHFHHHHHHHQLLLPSGTALLALSSYSRGMNFRVKEGFVMPWRSTCRQMQKIT
ncbi:hypothetical protein L1987_15253 [Smallanthus sonchifolius]|uniref:Uncharacterized protein n=1 Tax=Smallanthus sonchifolius TaxID=185202 RepID=A0ACB9J7A9_9ASTR|nr:hypothetical protein L1987_15253 [Smallanthus sonchifolius]